jgi:hypothetical protein
VLSYYVSLRSTFRVVIYVRYNIRIKPIFGSSFPPVVCNTKMSHPTVEFHCVSKSDVPYRGEGGGSSNARSRKL